MNCVSPIRLPGASVASSADFLFAASSKNSRSRGVILTSEAALCLRECLSPMFFP